MVTLEVAQRRSTLEQSLERLWRNFTAICGDLWRSEHPRKPPNRGHPYIQGTTVPCDTSVAFYIRILVERTSH